MMLAMGTAAKKPAGKQANFSEAQNAALRNDLKEFVKANKLTQDRLGELLDEEQQSAGRHLAAKNPTGFSYQTATRAARLFGFSGVDDYFRERGVGFDLRAREPVGDAGAAQQADGMRAARAVKVSEAAIQMVNDSVPPGEFHHSMWWATRYIYQQEAINAAERAPAPAVPPSTRAVETPRSRRKVGNA